MPKILSNNKLEKIAFILLNILAADLCIFGAGRLIEFGPLTFRMILLLLLFAACIPLFIKNFKNLFKSRYIAAILIFGILVVFSTFVGIINNNRISLIITDVKGFIYFAFLPCVIVLVNSYEKILLLAKTCMYSATVQALIHIIFICFYIADVSWLEAFAEFCDEKRFFYVSYLISSNNVRVNFFSSICLLLGIAFSIYFSIKTTSKVFKIIYPLITALCGFSLLISYTRSIYLAVGVTVITFLIFLFIRSTKNERIAILKHLAITVLSFSIITAGFGIKTGENYFTYALSRTFIGIDFFEDLFDGSNLNLDGDSDLDDDSDESEDEKDKDTFYKNTIASDGIRALTVKELITNIKKSPVIGLGLGAEIPSRPNGLNEYFFLDLLSKMGIIGLGCYLSPLIFMLVQLIQLFKKKNKQILLLLGWFCVLLGLIIYSYFTPCMNSSVGILPYCFIMAVFEFYKKSELDLEEQL